MAKKKLYRNLGPNAYHLKAREAGKEFFEFGPGEVIEPVDADEAKLLDSIHNVVEHTQPSEKAEEESPAEQAPAPGKKKKG